MNILMLTPRFPYPPTRGDCIRAWGELEYLSRRHRVWLACVDHQTPSAEHLDRVRGCCADVAVVVRSRTTALLRGGAHLLRGGSVAEGYFADRRLARQLRRWAGRVSFDAALVFAPEMARSARCVPVARRVLDMNDVESFKLYTYARRSLPPWRWIYDWESRRLAAAERRWVRSHDVCLLVNERERSRLERSTEPRRAAVVRTGVDLDRLATAAVAAPREPVIGFVGSMFYPPNVRAVNWFGRKVWPLVKEALPQAQWLIVGSRPGRSVRRWGRLPGVTVTGFVDDVRPYFARMRVFACGVHDEIGVQTKLIEALAAARPAVVTPEAAAGIDYDGDPPFLIADSPERFAAEIVRVCGDNALASGLSTRARAAVEMSYGAAEQYALVESWLAGATPAEPGGPSTANCGAVRAFRSSESRARCASHSPLQV